jgi:maltooligosyltrehalose trehalohydrolase
MSPSRRLGATSLSDGRLSLHIWAPQAKRIRATFNGDEMSLLMVPGDRGYHTLEIAGVTPGVRYSLSLDGGPERPDPASRFQPRGPHGPSEVTSAEFSWSDHAWRGLPLHRYIIYELHIGAFTPEGTFDAAIEHLGYLRDLGITAIELMPIAQFPGSRNWGYDGVGLYAAQDSYGGPEGLKRLVDAAHSRGLAVILDVVYNHVGPEGSYLAEFGPYFTDRYRTPWGRALNFDGEHSDEVRRYFIENALYWIEDCHIDALRLDAIHAIADSSPVPFIQDLTEAVHRRAADLGRSIHLIAESAANDARLIRPVGERGYGMDAQWNDDFHHALRTVITGETSGYYASYGRVEHLARAMRRGFVYTGEFSVFHKRRHGSPTDGIPGERFVVFAQNHDHVGNRMNGERLTALVCPERLRLAAAAVIMSPFVPLLFMGEEYAETAPFLYFISHTDPGLIEAVRSGRAEEFASFRWTGTPPDPQNEETFARSKLDHTLRERPEHRAMLEWYRLLLRLRRDVPALACPDKDAVETWLDEERRLLAVRRWVSRGAYEDGSAALLLFNFAEQDAEARIWPGRWRLRLDSNASRFGGRPQRSAPEMKITGRVPAPLPSLTFALYVSEET